MSYTPPLNGGRINATIGGNTAGASTLVSSGTLTLAGGNNITLSQNGNAITISGGAGGAAGSQTLGISNLGNTSGTSGVISGSAVRMLFAGGNNVTLSQSTNASSATITISAASQTVQTQNRFNATLSGNTAGVMAQVSSGTLTLAGGNNITLSQNGNAVTISGGAGGGGGIALANSQTTYTSGTAHILEGGGAVTIASSAGGQSLKISVPATSSLSATGAVSLSTNGSTISVGAPVQTNQTMGLYHVGNTTAQSSSSTADARSLSFQGTGGVSVGMSNGSMVISGGAGGAGDGYNSAQFTNSTANSTMPVLWAGNSNGSGNITLGLTGSTVTGSAPSGGGITTNATMWFPFNEAVNVVGQAGQASLGFMPLPTPGAADEVQVDRVIFPLYFTNASNTTGSLTVSLWMGLYTRSQSSISLAHSTSATASLAYSGNNNSASQRGIRLLSVGWTTSLTDNRYVVGIVSRSTTAGANASLSQLLASQLASNVSGMWGEASNASVQWPLGVGFYSATTSGLPASVAYSQIRGTNSLAARPPSWHMINGTA